MMEIVKGFWSKCLYVGMDEKLPFPERLKIELLNQLVMVGIPLLFLHVFLTTILNGSFFDLLIATIWLLILSSAFLLNALKQYVLARKTLVFIGSLFLFSLHFAFGEGSRLEFMYLVFVIAATYFFDGKTLLLIVVFVFSLFLVASINSFSNEPIMKDSITRDNLLFATIGYLVFSVLIVIALTKKVLDENRNYRLIIRKQNKGLKKSNEELLQYNYILSHDIKEPIRSIVSFSNLLAKEEIPTENKKEYLNFVMQSGKQLNQLVDDIQVFQTIDAHPLTDNNITVNCLKKDISNCLKASIQARNAKILMDFPNFSTSAYHFKLILKNLVSNSIKYNNSRQPLIEISGEKHEGYIRLYIKDNGIGFPKELIAKAFTMFKRLDSSNAKSSGLGLNISRKAADRLGGTLSIYKTEMNKGTTFLLQIPQ